MFTRDNLACLIQAVKVSLGEISKRRFNLVLIHNFMGFFFKKKTVVVSKGSGAGRSLRKDRVNP